MNSNMIKIIIGKYLGIYNNNEEPTYGELFSKTREITDCIYSRLKNNDDMSDVLTCMRLMAPLYELYDMIEYKGSYRNSDKTKMECELRNVIDDAINRGFFDGKGITEKEFKEAGITLNAYQLMLI